MPLVLRLANVSYISADKRSVKKVLPSPFGLSVSHIRQGVHSFGTAPGARSADFGGRHTSTQLYCLGVPRCAEQVIGCESMSTCNPHRSAYCAALRHVKANNIFENGAPLAQHPFDITAYMLNFDETTWPWRAGARRAYGHLMSSFQLLGVVHVHQAPLGHTKD
jgi:hypothetical protein